MLYAHVHTEPSAVPHGLLCTFVKSLPFLKLLHKCSPQAIPTLLHHGLKWRIVNISNITKEKFIRLRSDEHQDHGTDPPHQRLDVGVSIMFQEVTMSPFAREPHVISYLQRDIDPKRCSRYICRTHTSTRHERLEEPNHYSSSRSFLLVWNQNLYYRL
jgi:hypothetical protein